MPSHRGSIYKCSLEPKTYRRSGGWTVCHGGEGEQRKFIELVAHIFS